MRNTYIIETTSEIKNPEPDRRSKDWHKLPTIAAGKRFVVQDTRDGYKTIMASDAPYGWMADHSPLGTLIMANSKRVEPTTVTELAKVHDCNYGGSEILRVLLKLGRVTAEDFALVGKTMSEDENF